MKINNINGIQAAKDFFELPKKRKTGESKLQGDRVEISEDAKNQVAAKSLQNIVSEYLQKIPNVRKEQVESVARQVNQDYQLDREKLEVIAEKLLQDFGL